MVIEVLDQNFSFCKLSSTRMVDMSGEFVFVAKTDKEISLVCPSREVPTGTLEQEVGWRAFRLKDDFDFSVVGIYSSISSVLAENLISIFAVSTYDTDYIFVKQDDLAPALQHLEKSGYTIEQ